MTTLSPLNPWAEQKWFIPAVDVDFVAPMEDVLDLYESERNAKAAPVKWKLD